MAKISPLSSKYIVHATIEIDGVVDRPDVVGAIFGQIEGLLGADLELRELQRSGRIGRIEVEVESKNGKTVGTITIPSSLDKAETAIIGGALEIIERIGPCNANINVNQIEDERAAKRQQVVDRAKVLLKNLTDSVLPDSHELSDEVSGSVKISDIKEYGEDKLPAGPDVEREDQIIVVEGRADVINLLRHGFKSVIAINGTSVPEPIKRLSKEKTITLFCDGDRGGDLIIKEMKDTCDVDYITKAPDGKEVEELQMKEIHQAIRNRVPAAEWKGKIARKTPAKKTTRQKTDTKERNPRGHDKKRESYGRERQQRTQRTDSRPRRRFTLHNEHKARYKELIEELLGTRGAYLLDSKQNVLGKIPVTEVPNSLPNLQDVSIIIMDGDATDEIGEAADKARVKCLIASGGKPKIRTSFYSAEELNGS